MLTCAAWRFDRVTAGFLPLEPRAFERLTVVALGTAAAGEDHAPPRHVDRGGRAARTVVLVDAGRGVAEALRAAKIPPSQPDAVLLTSLLPENTVGLDDLLAAGLARGPARAAARARSARHRGARAARGRRRSQRGASSRARARSATTPRRPRSRRSRSRTARSETLGALALRAGALAGGPLPALAWRIEAGGRSAVVGGTGWDGAALEELARGANLLLHDANHVPTPEEAQASEPRRSSPSGSRARPRSTPTSPRSARSRGAPESARSC